MQEIAAILYQPNLKSFLTGLFAGFLLKQSGIAWGKRFDNKELSGLKQGIPAN